MVVHDGKEALNLGLPSTIIHHHELTIINLGLTTLVHGDMLEYLDVASGSLVKTW